MFERIAIMGCGSMGTVLGAYLSRAGLDVTMVDPYVEHVEALNKNGATVTGGVEFNTPVKACTPENMEGKFDLFFYLAKQTYNDTAIPQMVEHSHEKTYIATGQNGLPELAVAKYWPKSQIMGFPISWSGNFVAPGISRIACTETDGTFEFHLGSVEGPITPEVLEVQKILQKMCPNTTHLTETLMADRWGKVMINASWSGMSTVMASTFADAINDPRSGVCLVRIGRETVRTCHAMGITIPIIFGADYDKIYDFTDKAGEDLAIETVKKIIGTNTGKASMLQDLEKGRRCEIAMINGVVSEAAREHGVETPYCDAVVRIVSEIEEGKRPLTSANVNDMPDLPL